MRVAKGRGMTPEQVDTVAKGRVWTGAQAFRVGLVDEMGGLHDAMAYVAKELGKEKPSDLRVVVLPKPKTVQEQIIELLADSGMVYSGLKWQGSVMNALKPLVGEIGVTVPNNGIQAIEPLSLR
jgi:protease-4